MLVLQLITASKQVKLVKLVKEPFHIKLILGVYQITFKTHLQ